MIKIKISRNKEAIIDESMYNELKKYNWLCGFNLKTGRITNVYRNVWNREEKKMRLVYLHHQLMGSEKVLSVIDHIDGNPLNNQLSNLRYCTQSENSKNRGIQKTNTSGYKGVFYQKLLRKWRAQISIKNKSLHLGCFICKKSAAIAYNEAAIKYYGDFAKLNII